MGGTFTDVVAYDAAGAVRTTKAPTTADGVGGVLAALRQVADPAAVDSLVFGSTVATNALAQRRLAPVGLLATAGFRDLLDIRRLWRPAVFGHGWEGPPTTGSGGGPWGGGRCGSRRAAGWRTTAARSSRWPRATSAPPPPRSVRPA